MRSPLPILLALLLPTSALFAQSTPAATTLTKEERDHAIDYLKETQKDFLASINGLSDAQWKFKAAPDRWSIAECSEHIAVAEDTIWKLISEKMMKAPAAPEKRAEVAGKDEMILTKVIDRSRKAKAPEVLVPTGRFATKEELIKNFEATRAAEIAYLKDTKDDLRDHFEEHPAFKTLDAYQWFLLNGAHGKRHTLQIEEVKTDANYPKS
ncbi:MAG: DinB family protein [Verrucomicrobiota bacterium]|nr:DinB family protein [Verrucomicrobiota bacterium]